MSRRPSTLLLAVVGPLACAGACADSLDTAGGALEDTVAPPDYSDAGDVGTDSVQPPCDAGDRYCTTVARPCSETDWCPVPTPFDARYSLNGIWGSGPSDVWAVGSGGAVAHWDGADWAVVASGTLYAFNAVGGTGEGDVWMVSVPGMIFHASGYQGSGTVLERRSITEEIVNPGAMLSTVWSPPGGRSVLVAGDPATVLSPSWSTTISIWRSPEAAGAWEPFYPHGFYIRGIWGTRADDFWIAGSPMDLAETTVVHLTVDGDGGIMAMNSDLSSKVGLHAIWGSGPNDIWAVGRRGTIRHFTGNAAAWERVVAPTTEDLRAVWGTRADDLWIVGDRGVILHWNGIDWQLSEASFAVGPHPNLHGIWGSGSGDMWAVGESGTVLHSSGLR